MKNKEKFAKEIFDIAYRGDSITITIANNEIVPCESIECEECSDKIKKWCGSEYVERLTLTSKEKAFLDLLLPKCKYIARDKNDNLFIYNDKPRYVEGFWRTNNFNYSYVSEESFGNMFDFIKCWDEEPWSIEELKKLEVKE